VITIITGKVGSGKTTKLLSLYNELKTGDGFIIRKNFNNGIYVGQDIVRLSTGEHKLFSLKPCCCSAPQNWDEACRFGPYSFSGAGFSFADEIIKEAMQNESDPLYIDEIGPLELQGKGFSGILKLAISKASGQKEIYITVRDSCLDAVIKKFAISQYKTVSIPSNLLLSER
jgi:nucleoside-triphosphatase THEP1